MPRCSSGAAPYIRFEFDVGVLAADDEVSLDPSLNGVYQRPGTGPEGTYPTMLRLGVEFADGRKATNVGQRSRCEGDPQSPVLWGRGGGGSGASWRQTFWMWPLPPPGPLSFVCEWPAAGIPLSRAQIDGQSIIDAAAWAQTIFPDHVERESSPGWSSSAVQIVSSSDRVPDPEAQTRERNPSREETQTTRLNESCRTESPCSDTRRRFGPRASPSPSQPLRTPSAPAASRPRRSRR